MDSCTTVLKEYQIFPAAQISRTTTYILLWGNTVHGISVTFQFTNSSFGFHEICNFESVSVRPGTVLKGLVCTWGTMFRGSCK